MGGSASQAAVPAAERAAAVDAMYARYTDRHEAKFGVRWPDVCAADALELLRATPLPAKDEADPDAATRARPIFVDCRTAPEVSVSKIPGALTESEYRALLQAADRGKHEDRRVVAYCTVGYRSGKFVVAERARRPGADVVNLAGSLLSWTHAGGPLVDSEGRPTARLHVFASKWALAPEGIEMVTFPLL